MLASLLLQVQVPVTPAAVRDTISSIVLERGYYRNVTSTLLSRGWEWLSRTLRDLFMQAAGSRGTYLISLSLIALTIIAIIARSVIVSRARRRETEASADALLAQSRGLSAQGAYVDAAHLLYAAVIARLLEARKVRRHPSKTVGDYFRELRDVSDSVATPYKAFAQTYDIVAYGDGLCDATRFARLEQLAAPMLQLGPASPNVFTARAA